MDKKGFTLVELLGIIVILGVIATIGVSSIMSMLNKSKEQLVEEKRTSLEQSGIYYGQENQSELSSKCLIYDLDESGNIEESTKEEFDFCKEMTLGDLLVLNIYETEEKDSEGNKEVINNVTGISMKNDKVLIYKKYNRVYARACLNESGNETCRFKLQVY